jgi:hypothetical protein
MTSQKSGSSGSRPVPESEHKKAGAKTRASRERTQIPEDHLLRRTVVTTGFPRSGLVQFLFCDAPQKRKGFDSLVQLCREKLQDDPLSGCLFLFRNRRGDTIFALCYD